MFERLVGLQVIDEKVYQEYREAMMPILKAHDGNFGYDFKVSEVLINASENPINRVFTIYFPDKSLSEAFFSNPEYITVKEKHFNKSVQYTTLIAEYMK